MGKKIENKNTPESNKVMEERITKICIEYLPKRRHKRNNSIPKERKKLLNIIRMLKREKQRAYSKKKKKIFENKIIETEKVLLECRRK